MSWIRYQPVADTGVQLHIAVFDPALTLVRQSDPVDGARPLELLDLLVPPTAFLSLKAGGTVASNTSANVGGMRVVIVDRASAAT